MLLIDEPVEREEIVEEAKIEVILIKTDLVAKKYEVEADIEFEEAETEEEVVEIFQNFEILASELEGEEVVNAKEVEAESKLDMVDKRDQYQGAIRVRVNGMRVRNKLNMTVNKAKIATRDLSLIVGKALQSAKTDVEQVEVLTLTKEEGDNTIENLKLEIIDFKAELPESGAS